ncbi:hypothetical protein [Streptomyces sp. CoH27]|uniref:hypothetical protein n=1 Tax=Streptomyces sp. CoH27 TaxID=2875763 RepID=UPI001CD5F766|nr:hypothetical protein [Streptomyces sp. CoH27]
MSESVLSVIPTDPHWQPATEPGQRAAALVLELVSGAPDDPHADPDAVELDVGWHEAITAVDCGSNLVGIGCPRCGGPIDPDWYRDLLEAYAEQGDGLPTLDITTPCCTTDTSLDRLDYDWPCGFARFEIAAWNPQRFLLTPEELIAVGRILGHPVRQILARI